MMEQEKNSANEDKGLHEVRYSLREILQEVAAERESSSLGQEIVDQSEISKLFKRKKKGSRGKSGE